MGAPAWSTDHYHLSSNLGVGISEGCFIFDFASLPSEVHLAYHVHKSGRKTSFIIIVIIFFIIIIIRNQCSFIIR